ncbi:DUF2521 family protein [Texcoconibacillus texcoconensis]|nr:DUF2521 family protein [Texcoconibacillus texcoconensis]
MNMNVITTFGERQRQKQWKFERNILRNLSVQSLRKDVQQQFLRFLPLDQIGQMYVEDYCLDIGVDSYLLGASFSRFGYYGDTAEKTMDRCREQIEEYIDQVKHHLYAWTYGMEVDEEEFVEAGKAFVRRWWMKGFEEGEKQHRLKMH